MEGGYELYKIKLIKDKTISNLVAVNFEEVIRTILNWKAYYGEPSVIAVSKENTKE